MVAEHLADQVLRDTLGFFFGIRSGAQACLAVAFCLLCVALLSSVKVVFSLLSHGGVRGECGRFAPADPRALPGATAAERATRRSHAPTAGVRS